MTVPLITAIQLSEPGPDKPLLVLGASLGTSAEILWERVVPLLAEHAHLVAWDLPGHGRSPAPDAPFTVADLAQAVAEIITGLRGSAGRGDASAGAGSAGAAGAYYAGVSLGGATGLELALAHPGLVEGVAVICSGAKLGTPQGWQERAETVRAQGTPVMVAGSAQRWFAPGFLDAEPDLGARLLSSLSRADAGGYASCCEALAGYDVRDRLREITDPVLVISGEQDAVAPPELGREVADGVRSGTLVTVDRVAHLAPAEAPESTAGALLDLLGRPSRASHPAPTERRPGDPYDAGMSVRREVLGAAHVDRANASIDEFTADFQEFITRYAWGSVWTRPGLDRITRSAITLTALVAGGHDDELAMHVRAARRNGMTREQLREVLLQSAIYCSVPSANSAFKIAQRVLAEEDEAPTTAEPRSDSPQEIR